jgi:hypothetical protein
MRISLRPVALALLLLSSAAFAAAGRVSLQYQGPLGGALKQLADQGGINLVVSGNFDQPVQLMFKDLPADEALRIVAKTNHLSLSHEGDVWTLSPLSGSAAPTAVVPAAPPTPEVDQDAAEAPESDEDASEEAEPAPPPGPGFPQGLNVPVPPIPPLPPPPHHRGHSDRDVVGTGSLTVPEGQTVGDAAAFGGSLTVNGTVEGDATAFGGNVHLGPRAHVKGEVVAFGGKVIREDGARVDGQELSFMNREVGSVLAEGLREGVANVRQPEREDSHPMSRVAFFLMEFVLCFGLGFLFLMFVPHPMKQIEGELRRDWLRCGATGFLGTLAVVPLSVLLVVSVVGILVLPVLWVGLVLAVCMGYTAIANEIGIKLPVLRGKKTQATVLAVGTIVLLLVSRIPVLGPLALCLVGMLGLGAIIRTRFGTRPRGFPEPV